MAAGFALAAFWPRKFPVLEPSPLRTCRRAEDSFTRLTVHDTLEDFVNEGSQVLQHNGRGLGYSLWALTVAAGSLAGGIVVDAL